MRKLTSWYPGHVKPVRPGVYQRKYKKPGVRYCRFDGERWFIYEETVQLAADGDLVSIRQNIPWRGLAAANGKEMK